MIRVAVVDDHHVVREGICRLLAEQDDFEVVAQGEDGTDVEAIVQSASPDVLVLDMSMPKMSGFAVLELLSNWDSAPAIVVLSMQDDMASVERSLALGVKGYVLKQAVSNELVAAVHAAGRGSVYLCAEISGAFRGIAKPAEISPVEKLSPREREVAELVVAGLSTKQIAAQFNTSLKTVQKQRQAAMRKLNVPNTASLVRCWMELEAVGEASNRVR
jgi:DNA-binding NarL/FixJ family response regulator